uniref:Uncharacterized protein n=1 Tax=Anguilla anguilla TaxID=7936 RepID=A0A0E9PYB4_ANGAN
MKRFSPEFSLTKKLTKYPQKMITIICKFVICQIIWLLQCRTGMQPLC